MCKISIIAVLEYCKLVVIVNHVLCIVSHREVPCHLNLLSDSAHCKSMKSHVLYTRMMLIVLCYHGYQLRCVHFLYWPYKCQISAYCSFLSPVSWQVDVLYLQDMTDNSHIQRQTLHNPLKSAAS